MVDPQRDVDAVPRGRRRAGLPDRARLPDPPPRRFRRRPPRAARPGRAPRSTSERARAPSTRSSPMADGDAVRLGDVRLDGARDARPLARVDLDPRLRPRRERRGAVRGADRRHAVHRRRRPPRPARVARLERRASSPACSTTRCTRSSLPLPDETLVYPAHGAGSLCGKNLSAPTPCRRSACSARYNYALAPMSRERFIEIVTADQPDTPAYFTYDAVLNARERPTLDQALARELRPLSLDAAARAGRGRRAAARHARPAPSSRARTCRGASTSASSGSFATWCGTMLDPERPIVLIAEPGREVEAATRLGRIGVRQRRRIPRRRDAGARRRARS